VSNIKDLSHVWKAVSRHVMASDLRYSEKTIETYRRCYDIPDAIYVYEVVFHNFTN
jgi:hypothetical protein